MTHPLILTLALHEADQARFDRLRQLHFPPALNHIPAHITLFHHLPGDHLPEVQATLHQACRATPPFPIAVTGLRSLGRGTAFTLHAPPLLALRAALARHWHGHLTPQDRQGFRPHVTIQNKVTPAEAATLLATMQAAFSPFDVRAEGLRLFHYLGGPWEPAAAYSFNPAAAAAPPSPPHRSPPPAPS